MTQQVAFCRASQLVESFKYLKDMNNGWIKLHRKLLENPITNRPKYFAVWVTILLLANHKEHKIMWNGEVLIIKEGELLTGRKQLSEKTGIPQTTIEDILKYLESQHQIRQQKTTKFRVITVLNWKDYQSPTSNPTTSRQQADTYKNDNNEKKKEEEKTKVFSSSVVSPSSSPLEEEISYVAVDDNGEEIVVPVKPKKKENLNDKKTNEMMNLYRSRFKFISGKDATVEKADYYRVFKVIKGKQLSEEKMKALINWYVSYENDKFKQHPSLKSIFTVENINKFNLTN